MSKSPSRRSPWASTASEIELKRCRSILAPHLERLAILPDPMQADPMRPALPHLQALAHRWKVERDVAGILSAELELAKALVEHSKVLQSQQPQTRVKKTKKERPAHFGEKEDSWKTSMKSYVTGDLFASRGAYEGGMVYLSRVGSSTRAGDGGASSLGAEESLMSGDGTVVGDESMTNSIMSLIDPPAAPEDPANDQSDVSLLEISLSSDIALKRNCSGALLRLSAKSNFRQPIIQAGAVLALSNMFNTDDNAIKSDCAEALCNLIIGERTAAVLQPTAVAVVLVSLTAPAMPPLRPLCLGTVLRLLCCVPKDPKHDHHSLCIDNGIIGFLRDMVSNIMEMDEVTGDMYSTIIVKLAERRVNHPTLVSEGLIGLATSLLDTKDAVIRAPVIMDGEGTDGGEFGGLMNALGLPGSDGAAGAGAGGGGGADSATPAEPSAGDAAAASLATDPAIPGDGTDLNLAGDDTEPVENPIELLVGCCHQERGAMIITSLLATGEFLYPMLDSKIPNRIIELAKTKTHAVNTALRTLRAFAQYGGSRLNMVDAGIMAPLVAKVRASGKPDGKILALKVIRDLCVDPVCQPSLSEKGAIPALISISMLGEKFLEEDAAVALCSILLNVQQDAEPAPRPGDKPKRKKNLLELGALGALNALALSEEDELQTKAAATLADLAADRMVASKLVDAGGLDTLVKLARRDHPLTLQYVAVALGNLSTGSKRLQRRLVSNGVVHMVVSIVNKIPEIAFPESSIDPAKAKDVDRDQLTRDLQESVRQSCAAALGNLSYVHDLHIQFLKGGGLKALHALGANPSAGIKTRISCATGLCNVSSHAASRKQMIEMGCVPVMVALGRANPLEASKQDCARCLCNLTCEQGFEVTIAAEGAAGGLVMLALFRSDAAATKELCASALYNLLCDPVSRVALMREEVVWSFAKLVMTEGSSEDLRRITARMLCALSCISNARGVLTQQKAVAAIHHMVGDTRQSDTYTYIRRASAMTLRNLSFDTPDPFDLVKEGMVAALIELCTSAEPSIVYHVAAAYANLGTNDKCLDFMLQNDSVAVLLQLCQGAKPAVLRYATVTLTNMTVLPLWQKRLVQERVIAVLILCSDTKNYNQIRQCAQAFYNLTCTIDPTVRHGIVESGVTRALVNLVNGCLHAKEEIAAMKAASGGKMKYSPTLPPERETTLGLLMGGVCNLASMGDCRQRLAETHTPLLLTRVLEQSRRADVLLFALNSMCYLTARRVDLSRFISAGAVPALVELAKMGVEGTPLSHSQRRRPQITGADDPILVQLTVRRLLLRILCNLSHDVESRMRQTADGLVETAVALGGVDYSSTDKPEEDVGGFGAAMGESDATGAAGGAGAGSGAGSGDGGDGDGDGDDDEDEASVEVSGDEAEDDDDSVSSESGLPWPIKEEITEATARILWNVTRPGGNSTNAALFREKGVAVLLALAKFPTPRIQNTAVVALHNLSNDKPRLRRLGELGAVPILTRVVKTTKSNHTKDNATLALRNVTAEAGEDASEALVADGGVDMLVRLMMAGGGDAAAEGIVDGNAKRGPKQDDPKTDTFVKSELRTPGADFLDGIPVGVGFGDAMGSVEDLSGASGSTAERSQWISVARLPQRAMMEPFIMPVEVEYEEEKKAGSDDDSSDDEAEEAVPGEYPGPDQLDSVKDKLLWSRLGGGAVAETGLAAARLMREEAKGRAAAEAAADPLAGAGGGQPHDDDGQEGSESESEDDEGGTKRSWAPVAAAHSGPGAALRPGSPGGPLAPVGRTPTGKMSPSAAGIKPRQLGQRKSATRLTPLSPVK